jgi:ribulose-5-phosphate 4-epimerase/fuculose-1-phosphate aldolase
MNEAQARDEICRLGKSLFDRGYVHATAGNISVRLDDGFLITPTDACLGFLDPARLARLDVRGQQLSGDRASKTLALHRQIYGAASAFDPATRCVVHTHSTHCVALTLQPGAGDEARELLPAATPYFVMKVGHVPLIPYHRPGDPLAADLVAQTITRYGRQGMPIRAVMLSRLGPNVWHDSLARRHGHAGRAGGDGEAGASEPHAARAADRKPDQRPAPDIWRPLVGHLRPNNLNSEEK